MCIIHIYYVVESIEVLPVNKEILQLHHALVDLVGLMNQPQRDSALLQEAGVDLDRALFPLLVGIERKGPIGVVELANLAGRDYTTISRQVAKLESLGLIARRPSKADKRVREAKITTKGLEMTGRIHAARERIATALFANWTKRDLQDLARLMRRFVDDFSTVPLHKAFRPPSNRSLSPPCFPPSCGAAPGNRQQMPS
jgi:DNA-binding MarR family transcriptional regulator